MSKILKAQVISGRYQGQVVRISNVSSDELGRRFAACSLPDGRRANIAVSELEVIQDPPEPEPKLKGAKTASMPFVSGAASSRTMNQTKNMGRAKTQSCEVCGLPHPVGQKCPECDEE